MIVFFYYFLFLLCLIELFTNLESTLYILLNLGPQHPSTHGVLRLLSIIYGEIIQWIRAELGLLHRGSEKLMDYNYYNTSINYFDRLDYVSTIIQELLYVGALEIVIQCNTYLFSFYFRIIYIEIFRILNHYLALTTHIMDIGLFTVFLWGFEEREKLINYIESISGSRLHNALFAVNSIGVDFEKPSLNIILMFMLWLVVKYKELSYILSTISLFISRLYHVGICSLVYCVYVGFSGVLLRASYIFFDGRLMDRGLCKLMDYYIFLSMNSDCFDRFMIRINESLNSAYIVYLYLCGMLVYYDGVIVSKSMMQSIISFYLYFSVFFMFNLVISFDQWIKYFIESSKGIYCIMLVVYYVWSIHIILSDYIMMNQINSYCRVYNVGDIIAVLGSVDFVLGSVDI